MSCSCVKVPNFTIWRSKPARNSNSPSIKIMPAIIVFKPSAYVSSTVVIRIHPSFSSSAPAIGFFNLSVIVCLSGYFLTVRRSCCDIQGVTAASRKRKGRRSCRCIRCNRYLCSVWTNIAISKCCVSNYASKNWF